MRMSTDEDRDEEQALETIAAAAEAGITVFDTARAYGESEAIIGAAFRVANTLGCGFAEKVYENALAVELRSSGQIEAQGEALRALGTGSLDLGAAKRRQSS